MIFFIRLSHLVSKHWRINKYLPSLQFLFIRLRFETKQLSRIKKIINIYYQCSLPDPTPSASSLKINFQISDFDTYVIYCSLRSQFHNTFKTSSIFDDTYYCDRQKQWRQIGFRSLWGPTNHFWSCLRKFFLMSVLKKWIT